MTLLCSPANHPLSNSSQLLERQASVTALSNVKQTSLYLELQQLRNPAFGFCFGFRERCKSTVSDQLTSTGSCESR